MVGASVVDFCLLNSFEDELYSLSSLISTERIGPKYLLGVYSSSSFGSSFDSFEGVSDLSVVTLSSTRPLLADLLPELLLLSELGLASIGMICCFLSSS